MKALQGEDRHGDMVERDTKMREWYSKGTVGEVSQCAH